MIEEALSSEATKKRAAAVIEPQSTVLVSGSTGMVGRTLLGRLSGLGRPTMALARGRASKGEVLWDPAGNTIDSASLASSGARAVVHLAGENIAEGRWTAAKMDAIRTSRVRGTRLLAESLAGLESPPEVLVSASAIGFYGDSGDERLTESSAAGTGFLAEVCREWEQATEPARAAGIRVVNLRIGVVLSRDGGALAKMLLPFKLGLGGRLGSGDQFMSWITLDDLVSVICRALEDERLVGPVNATAPEPVSNRDYTRTLGRVLRRPTIAAMPAFAARAVFGRMADELLLGSQRVVPEKLLGTDFEFEHPRLEDALRDVLGASR